MPLGRNLAANAGGQAWSFLLNIVALPVYLHLLGPESYALVGFGLTVQVWATLLDAGMSPTLARDMARLKSGALPEREVHSFVRSLDWICLALVAIICLAGYLTRGWWGEAWFQDHRLAPDMVGDAVALIIAFSVIRWAAGLYRSAVMGLERQVLANAVSAAGNTLRLLGAIPILAWVPDPRLMFAAWVIFAMIELALFRLIVRASFATRLPLFHFSGATLKHRAGLAGGIAFLSVVWILITQLDKLVLARLLPMAEYGYFSLAVVLSNGILMVAVPIAQAYQPRLTIAATTGREEELRRLFHDATQLTVLATFVPAAVIAAFPFALVQLWTGDAAAARAVAPYLGYYLAGSALVGLAGLIYGLQLAYGNVRLHVAAHIVFAIVLLPAVIYVAGRFGAPGAARLWLAINLAFAIFYFPIVLRRWLPGTMTVWYLRDIALPVALVFAIAFAGRAWLPAGGLGQLLWLGLVAALAGGAAALALPAVRRPLLARLASGRARR